MEVRIWIPESISALRYCLKHPKSFIIGFYGFKRWHDEHQARVHLVHQLNEEKLKHEKTRNKLIEARKELTNLKR